MRRPRPDRRGSHDRWLMSYADLMTLLFAFFTTMYAISTVDAKKLSPAASSLQVAFAGVPAAGPAALAGGGVVAGGDVDGIVPAVDGGMRSAGVDPSPGSAGERSLADIRAQLTRALAGAIDEGRVELVDDPRGLVVSLPESATFATASADVTAAAREVVLRVAHAISPLGNLIRVEGHTDDVPIRTSRYRSNWELSTARASGVVVFLVNVGRIAPGRLSAAGYGEFHPRADNGTSEGRARNRRVDIVILGPSHAAGEPPPAGGPL